MKHKIFLGISLDISKMIWYITIVLVLTITVEIVSGFPVSYVCCLAFDFYLIDREAVGEKRGLRDEFGKYTTTYKREDAASVAADPPEPGTVSPFTAGGYIADMLCIQAHVRGYHSL